MKYYVCEGTPDGAYNASSKARNDVEYILKKLDFKEFYIPTVYGVQKNKLLKFKQFIDYKKNYNIWIKSISKLKKDDILLIQYPIINSMLGFEKVMDMLKEKDIKTIILIHDLDSLRFINMPRIVKEDKEVISRAKYIIAHNNKMEEKIIDLCDFDAKGILKIKIFDYIAQDVVQLKSRKKEEPIIIAGNLSKDKAEYLKYLKEVKGITFNLYGKGYEQDEEEINVNYKGAFLPEELLNNLEGSFGLVWDGTSKDKGEGPYGEYLKYNNPHKVSLYLTAGIPVIVWKESAMADFITRENVGITVDKLDNIEEKIKNLTNDEYQVMIENAKKISENLRKGKYLESVINKIVKGE